MRGTTRRRYDAHVRTNNVCTEHSATFDASSGGQKTRTSLGTYVADEERKLTIQQNAKDDGRAALEQIRRSRLALRDFARAIVHLGPLVQVNQPLMETLELPTMRSDTGLLAYMRALLDRASSNLDAFVAQGLPADLPQKVADEIDRFVAAKDLLAKSRQRFAVAESLLRDAQDAARTTIAALEAIAIGTPAAHAEVLPKLRMAKRVGPRAAHTPAAPPGPPVASDPPASPASPTDKAA